MRSRRAKKPEICTTDGCTYPQRAKGVCASHGKALRKTKAETPRCVADGCVRAGVARKMCETHYSAWRLENIQQPPCAVRECVATGYASQLCKTHYAQKRRYRLTLDQYVELLSGHAQACGICGEPPNGKGFAVDHDHETNRVRGLLCANCNFLLGHAKDNPDLLLAAAAYLLTSTDALSLATKIGQP